MTFSSLVRTAFRWLFNLDALNEPMPDLLPKDWHRIIGGAALTFIIMCYMMFWIGFGATALASLALLIIILWTHTKRTVGIINWGAFAYTTLKWGAYEMPGWPALLLFSIGFLYLITCGAIRYFRSERSEDYHPHETKN